MNVEVVDSKPVAVSCKKIITPVHFHDITEKSRKEVQHEIQQQPRFIEEHPGDLQAQQLKDQHDNWNREGRRVSRTFKEYLIDLAAMKVYSLNHPEKSA